MMRSSDRQQFIRRSGWMDLGFDGIEAWKAGLFVLGVNLECLCSLLTF